MSKTLQDLEIGDVVRDGQIVLTVGTHDRRIYVAGDLVIQRWTTVGLTRRGWLAGEADQVVPVAVAKPSPVDYAEAAMIATYRDARRAWGRYNELLPELPHDLDLTDEDRVNGIAQCPWITDNGEPCQAELHMIFDAHESADVYGWGKPEFGDATDILELHHGYGEEAETDEPTDLLCRNGHAWRVPGIDRRSSV